MQKEYSVFIGLDVSKDKLDYCITSKADAQHQFGIVANKAKDINSFLKAIGKKHSKESILFCLENTGVCSMPLCYWLQANGFDYWVVSALQIKRSKGITRGKTDKSDARDIALYAMTHLRSLTLSKLPENDFVELRLLLAERDKVVKTISLFQTTEENKSFLPKAALQTTLDHNRQMMSFLKKQLKQIDASISQLVARNPTFKQQDELLQSIPGVGRQTAVTFIAYTQAFTLFKSHRQFACFAGVAPFEYSSGSSVRGRTKVSQLANKKVKTLLNMAALSAKKYDPQIKEYYERKVAEGKNKMLVLNNVRCKLISRAFAVIQRDSPFVNTLKAIS